MLSREATTQILRDAAGGDPPAAAKLLPLVYAELRELAEKRLRLERPDHTLQPTALVHEAYLRLVNGSTIDWKGRTHFFSVAASAIRRVLVDHARKRRADKRGGDCVRVPFNDNALSANTHGLDIIALDDALSTLSRLSPRQAQVVDLRYFAGMSVEETASALGVSPRTVKGDWRSARAWLHQQLTGFPPSS